MFCGGFGGYGPYGIGSSAPISFEWMFLVMGLRLVIFIVLIVLAVRLFKKQTNSSNAAMRILDEKFARGEISEEEYLKRKTVLSQKN